MVRAFEDMSDQEIFDEFKEYYEIVKFARCYGTKDLINKDNLESELYKRGYEIRSIPIALKWNEDMLKETKLV